MTAHCRPFRKDSATAPVLFLTLLGSLAYGNSLHVPFVFDDIPWIVENDTIRDPEFKHLLGGNRPILNLSLALNYAVSKLSVAGYHVTNIAIHVSAGIVLFLLTRRLLAAAPFRNDATILRAKGPGETPSVVISDSATTTLSLAIAALWLVHPLQTQSVTYVIQRSESLMGLFYLLSLYCAARGATGGRAWFWFAAATFSCWLAVGTKESAVTIPVVTLILHRAFLTRTWSQLLRHQTPLFIGLMSSWFFFYRSSPHALAVSTSSVGAGSLPFTGSEYFLTQATVIVHYLKQVFWPAPLCIDYQWPVCYDPLRVMAAGLPLLLVLSLSVLAVRRVPRTSALVLIFFILLAPSSSVVPIADIAVEHRMYLALIPVTAIVVGVSHYLLEYLSRRLGARTLYATGAAFVCAVTATFVCLTHARNTVYAEPFALWSQALEVNPTNSRAYNELGVLLTNSGDTHRARECYRRAVLNSDASSLKPLAVYHFNYGASLHTAGDLDEALHHYRRALRIQPRSIRVHVSAGAAELEKGNVPEAIAFYRRALEVRPRYWPAHNNLALALVSQGEFSAAVEHFERAEVGGRLPAPTQLRFARALLGIADEPAAIGRIRTTANHEAKRAGNAAAAAFLDAATEFLGAELSELSRDALRRERQVWIDKPRGESTLAE